MAPKNSRLDIQSAVFRGHRGVQATIMRALSLLSSRSDVDGTWFMDRMFHVFHALTPLWNIYVEHKFPYSSAGYKPDTGTMFQCSSNFSFNLSVDRRPLLYVVVILLTKKYWNIWNIPHLTYNHAPFPCSTDHDSSGTLWNIVEHFS